MNMNKSLAYRLATIGYVVFSVNALVCVYHAIESGKNENIIGFILLTSWTILSMLLSYLCVDFMRWSSVAAVSQAVHRHEFETFPALDKGQWNSLREGHYVYVIQDVSVTGYCKIGRSNNPSRRLSMFAVKLPIRTAVIVVFPCRDEIAAERELHRQFAAQRIRGEWFALTMDDVGWIKRFESEQAALLPERTQGFLDWLDRAVEPIQPVENGDKPPKPPTRGGFPPPAKRLPE